MNAGKSKSVSRIRSVRPAMGRPLSLRLYPDPVLRGVCHPVEKFDRWLSDVFDEMFSLMRIHNGVGLAAPQVGIAQRFFAAAIGGQSVGVVNPVLVVRYGLD